MVTHMIIQLVKQIWTAILTTSLSENDLSRIIVELEKLIDKIHGRIEDER